MSPSLLSAPSPVAGRTTRVQAKDWEGRGGKMLECIQVPFFFLIFLVLLHVGS